MVDYITDTMNIKSVSDFARFWKVDEYENGVSSDVIEKVNPFNVLEETALSLPARLQRGRLRAAWLLADTEV